MGIGLGQLQLLLEETRRAPFSGKLLTLGVQYVHFPYRILKETADKYGIPLSTVDKIELSPISQYADKEFINDATLFRALGFDSISRLDASTYEGAELVFNLNSTTTPNQYIDTFDVILNGGTLEHIFHLPNALANLHKMLKTGGTIIHSAPANNYLNHGFYQLSPVFFNEYYEANGYELITTQIMLHDDELGIPFNWTTEYIPNQFPKRLSTDKPCSVNCIARKTKVSTYDKVPEQRSFKQLWNKPKTQTPPHELKARQLFDSHIKPIENLKHLNLVGTNNIALSLYELATSQGINCVYYDNQKSDSSISNIRILPVSQVPSNEPVVVCALRQMDELKTQLLNQGHFGAILTIE